MEFETLEDAKATLLKEEQDYLDAFQAYNEILHQTASDMIAPAVFELQNSSVMRGHERAATQPYIQTDYPELAQAARRLVKEEGEYRAVDEAVASFAQGNCSIAKYTIDKVYEYYAALEMVYKLATDDEFRNHVTEQIHKAYTQSAVYNLQAAERLDWQANNLDDDINKAERRERGERSTFDKIVGLFGFEDGDEFVLWQEGAEDKEDLERILSERYGVTLKFHEPSSAELRERQEQIENEADFLRSTAFKQIKDFFKQIWEQLKERYHKCGLFYAITTVGVDGAFLAGEILAGMSFLRALKFVTRTLADGRIKTVLESVTGRQLGEATISPKALDAKYGTPDENHLGGYEPDTNRQLPDKPAEEILEEKRRSEQQSQRQDQREDGSYRNPDDPEGVRRTADGEAMIQNKEGEWRPVSAMADPNRPKDNGRRHNPQVGRWGEVEADRYAASQGWEKVDGPDTTMDSPFTGPNRIDAIYKDPGPPPRYIVSDAKSLNAPQNTTKAGILQMSREWIQNRLSKSDLSPEDLRGIDRGYDSVILRVDKNGEVTPEWLDEAGNKIDITHR